MHNYILKLPRVNYIKILRLGSLKKVLSFNKFIVRANVQSIPKTSSLTFFSIYQPKPKNMQHSNYMCYVNNYDPTIHEKYNIKIQKILKRERETYDMLNMDHINKMA